MGCSGQSFLRQSALQEKTFVLPQGEPLMRLDTGSRPNSLIDVHTRRGKPRSPARQAGPETTVPR